MAEWFVFHNGSENGPFSDEAFLAFVKGKDPAAVHIWREGLDGWVLAKTVSSLAAAMATAEPARAPKPATVAAAQREPRPSTAQATSVPWPTITPRDRPAQAAEINEGASPEGSAGIAISADDKFPDASDESVTRQSKWNWAQYGALIGVVIGLIDVFYFRRGSLPAQGYIGAIFYFLGYVAACAAPFALVGFLAGAIRDRLRKNPGIDRAVASDDEIGSGPVSEFAEAQPPAGARQIR